MLHKLRTALRPAPPSLASAPSIPRPPPSQATAGQEAKRFERPARSRGPPTRRITVYGARTPSPHDSRPPGRGKSPRRGPLSRAPAASGPGLRRRGQLASAPPAVAHPLFRPAGSPEKARPGHLGGSRAPAGLDPPIAVPVDELEVEQIGRWLDEIAQDPGEWPEPSRS